MVVPAVFADQQPDLRAANAQHLGHVGAGLEVAALVKDVVGGQQLLGVLQAHGPNDVVFLLAASGGTPYVLGALHAARQAGALTVGLANNADAPVALEAEIGITLDTGEEVISGSTRLKAGTSQKIALNTISSALMVRLHKVYGNLMVDLKPTNAKLVQRSVRLTMHATGVDDAAYSPTPEARPQRFYEPGFDVS
eukprot:gene42812-53119_t